MAVSVIADAKCLEITFVLHKRAVIGVQPVRAEEPRSHTHGSRYGAAIMEQEAGRMLFNSSENVSVFTSRPQEKKNENGSEGREVAVAE